MKIKLRNTLINLIIFLAMLYVIPKIALQYHIQDGYTFKDNVAIISDYIYQSRIENLDENITFDQEVIIESDYIQTDDQSAIAIFSNDSIFDIGIMSNYYGSDPIYFYTFDFIYGEVFQHPNEIVISKSLSEAYFQTFNGVGQSIDINGYTYTVSGVLEDNQDTYQYMYFMDTEKEHVTNRIDSFYTLRVFQDSHLYHKLYQRGGENLIMKVRTQTIQANFILINGLLINVFMLIYSMTLVLVNMFNKKDKKRNDNKQTAYQKFQMSMILVTIIVISFSIAVFLTFLTYTSLTTSLLMTRDISIDYSYLLAIYLIPIVIYLIRIKHHKKEKEEE